MSEFSQMQGKGLGFDDLSYYTNNLPENIEDLSQIDYSVLEVQFE